jgi:acyl-CoA thioester hydrolase
MLPVIEAHCEFRESARYDDELNIETCGSLLSQARIEFLYQIVRSPDRIQLATGRHASVNLSGRPLRLPVDLQGALT